MWRSSPSLGSLSVIDRAGYAPVPDFQQGEIAPGILERIALGVERDGCAELRDLGLEIGTVGQQHAYPPRRRERDRGDGNRAQQLFLEVRPLTPREPARLQRGVHTAFLDRPQLQVELDPRRHTVCGIDDVRIGDEVAPTIHEPSSADLDERLRADRDGTLATIHRRARLDFGADERDSRHGEEQGLLDGDGERRQRCGGKAGARSQHCGPPHSRSSRVHRVRARHVSTARRRETAGGPLLEKPVVHGRLGMHRAADRRGVWSMARSRLPLLRRRLHLDQAGVVGGSAARPARRSSVRTLAQPLPVVAPLVRREPRSSRMDSTPGAIRSVTCWPAARWRRARQLGAATRSPSCRCRSRCRRGGRGRRDVDVVPALVHRRDRLLHEVA